jgi:hypothetical protein
MRTMVVAAAAMLLLCEAGAAWAQESPPATYSHKGQVGVHAQLGSGYRVLFPYNEEFCGQAGKSVCTGRLPFFLDVGLSYGVTGSLELLAEVRLGVESDFSGVTGQGGPTPLGFAAGLRFFVDAEGRFKFFTTVEGTIDTTDYSGSAGVDEGADVGVRNVNAIAFDFHRTFGAYVHFGPSVSFKTWLRFDLQAGVGIQARFP